MTRIGTTSLLALCLLVGAAHAGGSVVVVPLGVGPSVPLTVKVARSIVEKMNEKSPDRSRVVYPIPDPPATAIDATQAHTLLEKAHQSYKNLDFAAVRTEASKALQLFKKLVKAGGSAEGYISTLHLLAAAALFDGDADEAHKSMNDAVIFSKVAPPAKQFNPTVQQLYQQVLEKPDAEYQGSVRISAPDAMLWLNAKLHGHADGLLALRAGLYLFQIYRPGHAVWLRWFRIRPNQTRELKVKLKKTNDSIQSLLPAAREEASADAPGPALRRLATMFEAKQVILVVGSSECSGQSCAMLLSWGTLKRWRRKREVYYQGDPDKVAVVLLDRGGGGAFVGIRSCTLDSQCAVNERCINGRCQRPSSIVRKWWFWTAIGVAAAVATVAIVVPLTRPDGPVIEVR